MMPRNVAGLWKSLADFPRLYLASVLLMVAAAGSFICRRGSLGPSLTQNMLGIEEILATHHIYSAFLPIGYPSLLGSAELAGSFYGNRGIYVAVCSIQILLLVMVTYFARAILIHFGSARFATTTAFLLGLYPQYLSGVNRLNDTNLTLLTLLLVLLTLLNLRERATILHTLFAGVALGSAALVRPNLILMTLLVFWSVYELKRMEAARILILTASVAVLVYAAVTTFVHGHPFFPESGPYNLYAGFNSHTEATLRRDLNAENSIAPAMSDHGIYTHLDWHRPSNIAGINDPRDAKYIPFYKSEARAFIQQHPATSLRLCLLKFWTLMNQHYDNRDGERAGFHRIAVLFKRCILLLIPFWCGLLIYSKLKHLRVGSSLFVWMFVLYIVPFVLTNADPRFRITIEGIVLIDIARMLYTLYVRDSSLRRAPQAELHTAHAR